jgi:hypothetical protein
LGQTTSSIKGIVKVRGETLPASILAIHTPTGQSTGVSNVMVDTICLICVYWGLTNYYFLWVMNLKYTMKYI